ncbi:phage major capsid protein [Miniphocaeibacter massiliensis]|uniref:phage major capsid protein n=1 Tax=Miniphocaeibacter massiliensis TaxID=2041841 RepID=UPI000C1BAD81|nr:phage major capsid protein [Miniphocaeibacter massiliensis]
MNKIIELREKRANLWDKAKAFLDEHQKGSEVLSKEDTKTYEEMESEVVALGKEIDRLERQRGIDLELNRPIRDILLNNPSKKDDNKEYSKAFWNTMKGHKNPELINSLKVGTDPEGGYLVPDEFERQIIESLEEENILRKIAKTIQTSYGERLIPVATTKGTASWIAEEGVYEESDVAFDQVTLGAHKLGTMIKISEELLNDSAFNMEEYIAREFARRIGTKEEEAFFIGDGKGKPTGILSEIGGAEVSVTTSAGAKITFDNLIDLYYSIKEGYRKNSVFLMNEKTLKEIRKLKDTNGQYIWQPSVSAGEPDKILNRPVYTSSFIPEIAASAKTVLFGDFSFYWIADRQGRSFKRLNELYATNGQVGFLGSQRVDAKLILPEAIKVIQQGA